MRLPRVRFTVRRLMIAIATLAVFIAIGQTFQRWQLYRTRATWYAEKETAWRGTYEVLLMVADEVAEGGLPSIPFWGRWEKSKGLYGEPHADAATLERYFREEAALYEKWAAHCARMRRKWEDAMSRPWIAVEPDPTLPWYENQLHVKRYEESGGNWPPTPDWKPALPP